MVSRLEWTQSLLDRVGPHGFHDLSTRAMPATIDPDGPPSVRAHGYVRADGRIWDTTLPYGGGWLTPADFADRQMGHP